MGIKRDNWTEYDEWYYKLSCSGYQYVVMQGKHVLFRREKDSLRGWREVHAFDNRDDLIRASKLFLDE